MSPCRPELKLGEEIWRFLKNRFKNRRFNRTEDFSERLFNLVKGTTKETFKSITGNQHYLKAFVETLDI